MRTSELHLRGAMCPAPGSLLGPLVYRAPAMKPLNTFLQLRVRSPHFRHIRGVYITSSSADGALITPGLLCREMLQEYGRATAVRIFLFSPVCRCGVAARLPSYVRVTLPMLTTQDWRPDPHDEMGRSDVCSSRRAVSGRARVHLLSDVRAG